MDWGDVPAWAALALSGVAVAISWKARGDGKRSADAAQSSAESAAGSLALQREEADERRQAATPRPRIVLERSKWKWCRLRNAGDAPASNVTVHEEPRQGFLPWDVDDGIDLEPGQSIDFMIARMPDDQVPTQLRVHWDELGEGGYVHLPVPLPRF